MVGERGHGGVCECQIGREGRGRNDGVPVPYLANGKGLKPAHVVGLST